MARLLSSAVDAGALGPPLGALEETAGALLRGLHAHALPCFELRPSSLTVLHTPDELHAALRRGAVTARCRVALASLYIGVGPAERALVEALAADPSGGGRSIHVLLDYHRALRPDSEQRSSLTTLAPLAACNGATVELFRPPTSATAALLAPLLPPPLREVWGVQHAKAAVFDDNVLLTGANLSHDYLTTRQDRALLIAGAPRLADFVCELLRAVGDSSARLQPAPAAAAAAAAAADASLPSSPPPPAAAFLPPAAPRACPAALGAAVEGVLARARRAAPPPPDGPAPRARCWLLPSVQLASAGLHAQATSTRWLLGAASAAAPSGAPPPPPAQQPSSLAAAAAPPPSRALPVLLSSPYLNLPDEYTAALLPAAARAPGEGGEAPRLLLAGAPSASSFHGAPGLRGLVPLVYTHLEELLAAAAAARGLPLLRWHYRRRGWTFHAKGLWLWPPMAPPAQLTREPPMPQPQPQSRAPVEGRRHPALAAAGGPVATLLGSSNLGHRSVGRDLELGACLVTTDDGVRALLQREQQALRAHAAEAAAHEGDAPLAARVAARVLRGFF